MDIQVKDVCLIDLLRVFLLGLVIGAIIAFRIAYHIAWARGYVQ